MKLAQTNLSKLAETRPAIAKRLDCGVLSAAFPRLSHPAAPKSGDESPQSRRFAPFAALDLRSAGFSPVGFSGPFPWVEGARLVGVKFSRRECGSGIETK